MGEDEVKQIDIGELRFDAVRITDCNGLGFIELRWPGTEGAAARITYHGSEVPMVVTTFGHALPLPVVEWLIDRGKDALA